jgi:hypothetical protein
VVARDGRDEAITLKQLFGFSLIALGAAVVFQA